MRRMYRPLLAAAAAFTFVALACDGGDSDPTPTDSVPTAELTAGCSPASAHDVGESRETLTADGAERQYLLNVPASYEGSEKAAVVIALHGLGSSAADLARMTDLAGSAGERGMISVFPEGTGDSPGWNHEEFAVGPDDSAFLDAIVGTLAGTLCIDEARIYVTGYSNGGGMALRFACDGMTDVAAVAAVAATFPNCRGDTPLIAFHGNADLVVPYEGGVPPGATVALPPVHRAASEWARGLGCDGLPLISRASADVELSTYANCPAGDNEALLYTVLGGGHTWPGAAIDLDTAIAGATTHSVSANDLMLDFFDAHGGLAPE
jgi:polyhydroxybutyrate depolymerase